MRAACRLQAFCGLFGARELSSKARIQADKLMEISYCEEFDLDERYKLFSGLFSPWEVEEMACISDYLELQYRHLLRSGVDEIFDGDTSQLDEIPHAFDPEKVSQETRAQFLDDYGVGQRSYEGHPRLVSLGPVFFGKVMSTIDVVARNYLLSCQLDGSSYTSIRQMLHEFEGLDQGLLYPGEIYQEYPAGATRKGLPRIKCPSAGWTMTRGLLTTDDSVRPPGMLAEGVMGTVFRHKDRG